MRPTQTKSNVIHVTKVTKKRYDNLNPHTYKPADNTNNLYRKIFGAKLQPIK